MPGPSFASRVSAGSVATAGTNPTPTPTPTPNPTPNPNPSPNPDPNQVAAAGTPLLISRSPRAQLELSCDLLLSRSPRAQREIISRSPRDQREISTALLPATAPTTTAATPTTAHTAPTPATASSTAPTPTTAHTPTTVPAIASMPTGHGLTLRRHAAAPAADADAWRGYAMRLYAAPQALISHSRVVVPWALTMAADSYGYSVAAYYSCTTRSFLLGTIFRTLPYSEPSSVPY